MPTTCQDIINRAVAFSIANAALASDPVEMLTRIRSDQRDVFTLAAKTNRDYLLVRDTPAPAGGLLDLAALTPPLARLIRVELPDGTPLSRVDLWNIDAAYAPRYTVEGLQLRQVADDWGAAPTLTVIYAKGPTALNLANTPASQDVSVDDEWTDLLVLPLAKYLARKDVGRSADEIADLDQQLAAKRGAFTAFLEGYGGALVVQNAAPEPDAPA